MIIDTYRYYGYLIDDGGVKPRYWRLVDVSGSTPHIIASFVTEKLARKAVRNRILAN